MYTMIQNLLSNLSNPTLLFFVLGILAVTLRSDLEIPGTTVKFISLYLLLSIGFKGGQELQHSECNSELMFTLMLAFLLALCIPIVVFFLLKKTLSIENAGVLAAAYGSVSAVTFITATTFLESKQIGYGGHMVAAMAIMEAPAIIVGMILINLYTSQQHQSLKKMAWHAITNGSVLLIVGSLLIGMLSDAKQAEGIKPFTTDIFKGFLSVYLLDLGMITAKRYRSFTQKGGSLIIFGILFPLIIGSLTAFLSGFIIHSMGNRLLLSVLAASASYIAVPAAMRQAVPSSDPGIYIPITLGVTFPVNISVGMLLYLQIIYLTA